MQYDERRKAIPHTLHNESKHGANLNTVQAYVAEHQLKEYSESTIGWIFGMYVFLACKSPHSVYLSTRTAYPLSSLLRHPDRTHLRCPRTTSPCPSWQHLPLPHHVPHRILHGILALHALFWRARWHRHVPHLHPSFGCRQSLFPCEERLCDGHCSGGWKSGRSGFPAESAESFPESGICLGHEDHGLHHPSLLLCLSRPRALAITTEARTVGHA